MTLTDQLAALAALMTEAQALAAPYDAQIRALEIAKADALAALTFHIDTLKATVYPLILAAGSTRRVPGLTVTMVHKQGWDSDGLQAFAQEVPAVLQFQRDASYVVFRVNGKKASSLQNTP